LTAQTLNLQLIRMGWLSRRESAEKRLPQVLDLQPGRGADRMRKDHEPSMEFRRRVPRVAADGWSGRYIIEDDPDSNWSDCRVLDISVIGVGLELFGDASFDLVGHRLVVQVQAPVGESVSLRLAGRVMNQSKGPQSGTRAGLEFVGLSEAERSILKVLEIMKVAW
jgi:PilZ domain